jgi:hypothetical protein
MSLFTWETALSASLLLGMFVNLKAAQGFLFSPAKAALGLGVVLENDSSGKESSGPVTILRLVGVCLIALAMFYLLTAIGPLQQTWNVVVAALARLTGVAFYGWAIAMSGAPTSFKKFFALNLGLALAHILFLVLSPTGLSSLQKSFSEFHWISLINQLIT